MMSWSGASALVVLSALLAVAAGASEYAEVRVRAGAPLRLECELDAAAAAPHWRRAGGGALAAGLGESEEAAGGRLLAVLSARVARAEHAGRYECGGRAVQLLLAEDEANITYYEVYQKLELNCTLSNPDNKPYLWRKNGTLVAELADVKARYRLDGALFTIPPKTTEDDFGNYSCAVGDASLSWVVHGQPHVKLPANTNVVEGEKMKLQCRVIGKPHCNVTWSFISASGGNGSPVAEALGGRVELGGPLGEELLLHNTSLTDAGRYVCAVEGRARAETVVRVKDMYAALWPFLGICAEVFVLCAVILVYERRRTKPELDDSDTDNHDQKKS